MDWTMLILGLSGPIVAVVSLWLNYLSRIDTYQQSIYLKQVEASQKVMGMAIDLWRIADEIKAERRSASDEDRKRMSRALRDSWQDIGSATLLLPNSSIGPMVELFGDFEEVANGKLSVKELDKRMERSFPSFANAIRKDLNIDPLTEATKRMVSLLSS